MSIIDDVNEQRKINSDKNKLLIMGYKKNIEQRSQQEPGFKKNIELLDTLDLSEFLSEGRSLYNIIDAIESKYDKYFWNTYHTYVFDWLNSDDICSYLASRYNVWFQEYTDWVVRHDNGAYDKTRKRTEDSP